MADLRLQGLRKVYGPVTAVDRVSLEVEHGEFVALVGPSGCGKTTILRMVAGLIEPDEGRVFLGETEVTWTPVHRRNIGMMFQSYALFPHMTVFENVAFGLRRRGLGGEEIRRSVARMLALVQLEGLDARYPGQLSGGQQQRVALARALATEPTVLLLDEPLSNLDAQLRDVMRVELKRLQEQLEVTTIFVTHDQNEALTMSDRIVVLNRGRVEQVGTPAEVYYSPANSFVAGFIGRSNFLSGEVVARPGGALGLRLADGLTLELAAEPGLAEGMSVQAALRPERIRLMQAPTPGVQNSFRGSVLFTAFAGARSQYLVRLDGDLDLLVEAGSARADGAITRKESVFVEWDPTDLLLVSSSRPITPAGPAG